MWDGFCCTTNTTVDQNGNLIMGKGVALLFKQTWPWIAADWGKRTRLQKNPKPCILATATVTGVHLISFPTKTDWRKPSSMTLIERSAKQLMLLIEAMNWQNILLPRPGCANGGLCWTDVKELLLPILDDRVTVISHNTEL